MTVIFRECKKLYLTAVYGRSAVTSFISGASISSMSSFDTSTTLMLDCLLHMILAGSSAPYIVLLAETATFFANIEPPLGQNASRS